MKVKLDKAIESLKPSEESVTRYSTNILSRDQYIHYQDMGKKIGDEYKGKVKGIVAAFNNLNLHIGHFDRDFRNILNYEYAVLIQKVLEDASKNAVNEEQKNQITAEQEQLAEFIENKFSYKISETPTSESSSSIFKKMKQTLRESLYPIQEIPENQATTQIDAIQSYISTHFKEEKPKNVEKILKLLAQQSDTPLNKIQAIQKQAQEALMQISPGRSKDTKEFYKNIIKGSVPEQTAAQKLEF